MHGTPADTSIPKEAPEDSNVLARPLHGPLQGRAERLVTRWQVQDRTCVGTHPTDLQNADAHAMTCRYAAPPPNFGTISTRDRPKLGCHPRRHSPDQD